MGYKEKIQRIESARVNDEDPLAIVLSKVTGKVAYINPGKTARENREGGDVKLDINGFAHSFEMQVSRKYKNFSYTKAKLTQYVGSGDTDPRWVVLGCLDEATNAGERDGDKMFYCLVGSVTLRNILEEDGAHVRLMDDKYYIIRPEAFIGVPYKWIGNTLEEMVTAWWGELRNGTT